MPHNDVLVRRKKIHNWLALRIQAPYYQRARREIRLIWVLQLFAWSIQSGWKSTDPGPRDPRDYDKRTQLDRERVGLVHIVSQSHCVTLTLVLGIEHDGSRLVHNELTLKNQWVDWSFLRRRCTVQSAFIYRDCWKERNALFELSLMSH